jgi:hypothetical protein
MDAHDWLRLGIFFVTQTVVFLVLGIRAYMKVKLDIGWLKTEMRRLTSNGISSKQDEIHTELVRLNGEIERIDAVCELRHGGDVG